jgi:hypothetical protein
VCDLLLLLQVLGAIAMRSGSEVLAILLPAAVGLSLGAGQGSSLAKTLLPTSRLPARMSSLVVATAMPMVAPHGSHSALP